MKLNKKQVRLENSVNGLKTKIESSSLNESAFGKISINLYPKKQAPMKNTVCLINENHFFSNVVSVLSFKLYNSRPPTRVKNYLPS